MIVSLDKVSCNGVSYDVKPGCLLQSLYQIKLPKVVKFIINRIDEGKNLTNQINNDSAIDKLTVALLALAKNQQQIAPATTTNETQSFKIATSPQIKRKASSSIENNYITLDDESENDNSFASKF